MSWKHNGYTINVNPSGQFYATLDDDGQMYAASLAEAKQKIEQHVKQRGKAIMALPIVAAFDGTTLYVGTLTGLSRVDSTWQTDPPFKKRSDGGRLIDLMADTPGNRALIETLIAARKQLRDAETAIKGRTLDARTWGGRIDVAEYEAIVAKLKTQHAASATAEEAS